MDTSLAEGHYNQIVDLFSSYIVLSLLVNLYLCSCRHLPFYYYFTLLASCLYLCSYSNRYLPYLYFIMLILFLLCLLIITYCYIATCLSHLYFSKRSLKRDEKISKEGPKDPQRRTIGLMKIPRNSPSSFWRLKGFGPEDQSRKAITIDPKWRVFDDNRLRHHMILVRSTTEGCGICNILSRD